jgi:hypothetical protein
LVLKVIESDFTDQEGTGADTKAESRQSSPMERNLVIGSQKFWIGK